jgi:hypothetical protein
MPSGKWRLVIGQIFPHVSQNYNSYLKVKHAMGSGLRLPEDEGNTIFQNVKKIPCVRKVCVHLGYVT